MKDSPLQYLSLTKLLKELCRHKLGNVTPRKSFTDNIITWNTGENGSIRIAINTNLIFVIQRKIELSNGKTDWITYYVVKTRKKYDYDKEEILAADLFHLVKSIAKTTPLRPKKNFKDLQSLCLKIINRVKGSQYKTFLRFNTGIEKKKEKHYLIMFDVSFSGVGQIVRDIKAGSTPACVIDLYYNNKTGIIKYMLYTIAIEGESQSWQLLPASFELKFSPLQDKESIADTVLNTIRFTFGKSIEDIENSE